jgi:hypothetical protein
MSEKSADLSKMGAILDIPYPRKLYADIQKGKEVNFQELINTGMVISFIIFNEKELESRREQLKLWAEQNKEGIIFVDFDKEQKDLNRFLEINKNSELIDQEQLINLFTKICIYSSNLSEHIENSSLVSADAQEILFGNGQKAWYYVISSHPDLIKGKKVEQYCNESLSKLHKELRKNVKLGKKFPSRVNFTKKQKDDARNRQNGKCNKCDNYPPRWEYNHKDGDRSNNKDSNCEALCPDCHSVVTYDES